MLIKELRQKRLLSQEQLAELCGLSLLPKSFLALLGENDNT